MSPGMSGDPFETSLRATMRGWRQGELSRRQAVELMARAIELQMNPPCQLEPSDDEQRSPGATVYIHYPQNPDDPEERVFEELYDEARALWVSGRGIRRSGC
jgi:hypothetical protein